MALEESCHPMSMQKILLSEPKKLSDTKPIQLLALACFVVRECARQWVMPEETMAGGVSASSVEPII